MRERERELCELCESCACGRAQRQSRPGIVWIAEARAGRVGQRTTMMAATSDERSVMEPGKTNSGQSQPIDRLKLLYPMVDEEKTPLPRSWSTKDKYSYIGLSQNNLRVHYKGTWVARQRATSARARRCASFVARTRVCASSVWTSAPCRGPSGRPSPASCLCCVAPRLGCSRGRHGRSIENGRALFQRVSAT